MLTAAARIAFRLAARKAFRSLRFIRFILGRVRRPALQFCVNVEVVAVAIKLRGYGPLAANHFLELRAAPEGVGINAITDSGQIELVDTDAESGGGMGFNRSPIPDRRRRRSVLEPR